MGHVLSNMHELPCYAIRVPLMHCVMATGSQVYSRVQSLVAWAINHQHIMLHTGLETRRDYRVLNVPREWLQRPSALNLGVNNYVVRRQCLPALLNDGCPCAKTHPRKLAGWSQLPLPRRMKPPDTPHHLSVRTKTPTIVREEVAQLDTSSTTCTITSRDTRIITSNMDVDSQGSEAEDVKGNLKREKRTSRACLTCRKRKSACDL
jgi:hypothetical protein